MAQTINPQALTATKLAFENGFKSARKGMKRDCGYAKNPLLKAAFERGYDEYEYQKKMKGILK